MARSGKILPSQFMPLAAEDIDKTQDTRHKPEAKSKHQPRMYTQMFLEDGATGRLLDEGASARIYEYIHDPSNYVVKQQKRLARESTHPPAFQQQIQQWSYQIVQPPNFTLLRVPAAFRISESVKATSYVMERIDTTQPELLDSNYIDDTKEKTYTSQLIKELILYYYLCSKQGYFPNDYELYKQTDGKYALVDFDKYGVFIAYDKIEFPFNQIININQAQIYCPFAIQTAGNQDLPDESRLAQIFIRAPQPPTSLTLQAMKPRQEKPPKSPHLRHVQDNLYAFVLDPKPFSL